MSNAQKIGWVETGMFNFLKKLWHDQGGNALMIAGASLTFVVGMAGMATDTIQWTTWKRELQRSADSAALAGAFGKLAGQTLTTGTCSTAATPAVQHDLDTNNHVGYTTACTAQNPPTVGSYTADNNAVRVSLSVQHSLSFSSLFFSAAPTITASATATMVQNGKYCVVSLDNNAETGLNFSGNSKLNLGCGMKTNATGTGAVDCGGSSQVTASPIAAVGAITACSNWGTATTVQPYSPPQADPYKSVNAPTVPNGCNNSPLKYNGSNTSITPTGGTTTSPVTLCYSDFTVGSGKTFSTNDAIIIINDAKTTGNNGNLDLQGTVTCTRCVFILTTNNTSTPTPIGNVTINAGAHLTLTPPATGCTLGNAGCYDGILIYQDRRATPCSSCVNKINGDSTSSISGAIYIPNQQVDFNGNSGMDSNCIDMVAWQVSFSGNSNIGNSCPGGPKGFDGWMVRLVE